jgi:hypothetical protein
MNLHMTGNRKAGDVMRRCGWDEYEFETESFVDIAQLTLRSGPW